YLEMVPAEAVVDVWLMHGGEPGAEELGNDIYLYAIGRERAPAEWLREIAHEYSHLVVPVVGPFTAPEKWGNGYLGERLFLGWLVAAEQTGVWGPHFDGAGYLANQVRPLRDRFLDAGPGSLSAARADAAAMERFIG